MRKLLLAALLTIGCTTLKAQLTQNFNTCAAGSMAPTGWSHHNPVLGTATDGNWSCGPGYGRDGTPGISCTGYYSAAFHLDTAYLIAPPQLLTSGPIYLNFDTKVSGIHLGAKLAIVVSGDSAFSDTSTIVNKTSTVAPVFGNNDSTDWVTHQADLTQFVGTTFYVAFRYTSSNGGANQWYLDNVKITNIPLSVSNPALAGRGPVLNASYSFGDMNLNYNTIAAGTYNVMVYDMVGRTLASRQLTSQGGAGTHTLSDLSLLPGMYIVRMGNETGYTSTKVVVW